MYRITKNILFSIAPSLQSQKFDLVVKNLRFQYNGDDPWALNGVDFYLPEGGRLAIVGLSGSGKSTLVNLLLRFWDLFNTTIGENLLLANPRATREDLMEVARGPK